MSGWKEFKTSVSRLAQKASQKTEELADSAALRLRLNEARGNLDEAYAGLGRLMYARLREGTDNTVEIDAVMSRIDTLTQEIGKLETTIEGKKAAKQASREAKKNGGAETGTADGAADESANEAGKADETVGAEESAEAEATAEDTVVPADENATAVGDEEPKAE